MPSCRSTPLPRSTPSCSFDSRVRISASVAALFGWSRSALVEELPELVVLSFDITVEELCNRFKTHPNWGNPRIVLLARSDAPEDHAEAVRAGADDVLFKPLERDELVASVRRLTDFDAPRGLPRAEINRPVEITTRGQQIQGIVRNVSRGGLYVDTHMQMTPAEEVSLQFSLDENGTVVAPTARVVWSEAGEDGVDHTGLRFLKIDAQTIEKLDHYISENYPCVRSLPA